MIDYFLLYQSVAHQPKTIFYDFNCPKIRPPHPFHRIIYTVTKFIPSVLHIMKI